MLKFQPKGNTGVLGGPSNRFGPSCPDKNTFSLVGNSSQPEIKFAGSQPLVKNIGQYEADGQWVPLALVL